MGNIKLGADLDEIAGLIAAHGTYPVIATLDRDVEFGRFRANDVRSILGARTGLPRPPRPREALIVELPVDPSHPLSD